MQILVADDDPIIRTLLKGSLTTWGYDLVMAANGYEAWEVLKKKDPPRIAIIDWLMPGLQGVELCRRIRGDNSIPYIYLILLTSKHKKEDIVEGLDAGADDFLSKPVNASELRSRIAVGVRILEYEAQLRLANQQLEIYFQAFRSSMDGVCITDPEGNIVHVNQAWEELFGYLEKDVKGKNTRILNPGKQAYSDMGFSEEVYDHLFSDMWNSIRDPNKGRWEGELANRGKDGNIRWIRQSISSILDASGNVIAYVSMPIDITLKRREELNIRVECYRAITELAEMRDNETGNHLKRMSVYSRFLAQNIGVSKKFVEDIEIFAPLHDIGKVGIIDAILLAPARLTQEQFSIMKTHTSLGFSILKNRPTLEMAADIAYCHHERWDGTGYPRGLKGEGIPLSARIVSVADVYDALRSHRPYKEPWPHAKVVEEIAANAGTQFDPEIVQILLEHEAELLVLSEMLED